MKDSSCITGNNRIDEYVSLNEFVDLCHGMAIKNYKTICMTNAKKEVNMRLIKIAESMTNSIIEDKLAEIGYLEDKNKYV